jgi:hypothetical protein
MIRSRQLWPLGIAIGVLAGLVGVAALLWTFLRADNDFPSFRLSRYFKQPGWSLQGLCTGRTVRS